VARRAGGTGSSLSASRAARRCGSSLGYDLDHPNRPLDSFQPHRTPSGEPHAVEAACKANNRLAGEDFPGLGESTESCRQVEGAPAKAAFDRDGFSRVEPDANPQRERIPVIALGPEAHLEIDCGSQRPPGRGEDTEGFVTPQLEDFSVVGRNRLARKGRKFRGQRSPLFVSVLLGEARVPSDVGYEERADVRSAAALLDRIHGFAWRCVCAHGPKPTTGVAGNPGLRPVMNARDAAERWRDVWARGWCEHKAGEILALYAPEAYFQSHPFRQAQTPSDYIEPTLADEESTECEFGEPIVDGHRVAVEWSATTNLKDGRTERLAGVSLLRFDPEGLVVEQRDFWASG
jgi:hypothetical protein